MSEKDELGGSVPIPTYLVVLILGAAFTGGAGLNSYFGPRVQDSAIEQCSKQAEVALSVAAQHGEEFVEVNRRISVLRDYINERTAQRYTTEVARKDWNDQEDRDERQNRWLAELERRLQQLEKTMGSHEHEQRNR